MVEYLVIIQARLNSSRLPAKVMLDIAGKTLIERVYESVNTSKKVNKVLVATSFEQSDDVLTKKMTELNIEYYRGSLDNVLERFYSVAIKYRPKYIIRVTADNPLNGDLIDDLIARFETESDLDYLMFQNSVYGTSPEIFRFDALEHAYKNAVKESDKEHVTLYIRDNLRAKKLDVDKKYRHPELNASVDTFEDYIRIVEFYYWCINQKCNPSIETFIKHSKESNNVDR